MPPEEDEAWGQATPLTRELVLGCLRHKGRLDAWVGHCASRPPPAEFRPILWLGLLQLLVLDGIAEHAALHETVEAAKAARFPKALVGFANGLLRHAQRNREALLAWMAAQPLWVRSSHPEWMVRRWTAQWGEAAVEQICAWNQQRARTFVRRTPQGPADAAAELTPVAAHPGFFVLERGISPVKLEGFAEGGWYVQDPSTAIAPGLLAVQPGEAVLDACAAPGGKTALLAEALGDGGRGLVALEPQPGRFARLQENLQRLGLKGVEARCGELQALQPVRAFDAVLLDVPCSNTGVLQRRPDARWRFTRKSLQESCALQQVLLDAGAGLVRPGGRLVYSTCSIEPEETGALVSAWLKQQPAWRLVESKLQLPGGAGCDGAYAALLIFQPR